MDTPTPDQLSRCEINPKKMRFATYELADARRIYELNAHGTEKRIYQCDKDSYDGRKCCGMYHLATDAIPLPEETTSSPYAAIDWSKVANERAPLIPVTCAPRGAGRPRGSTSTLVDERRNKVGELYNADMSIAGICAALGVSSVQSDLQYLRANKRIGYRNDVGSVSVPRQFVKPTPHVPTAAEKLEAAMRVRAAAEAEIAQLQALAEEEEQDRIELERVRAKWAYRESGEHVLEIRKKDCVVSAPAGVWKEILKAAGEEIQKLDNGEIALKHLSDVAVGTVVAMAQE